MDSGYLKVQIRQLSLVRVWVTVGTGPQCCNGETSGPPIKGYILYCKRVSRLVSWSNKESIVDSRDSKLLDCLGCVEAKIWFCY